MGEEGEKLRQEDAREESFNLMTLQLDLSKCHLCESAQKRRTEKAATLRGRAEMSEEMNGNR